MPNPVLNALLLELPQAGVQAPAQPPQWQPAAGDGFATPWQTSSYNLALAANTATTQAHLYLWRWDFDDQLPKWQGAPDAAAPIQLLTAQHFFAAGGAAQAKFWRSDYLIEIPQWQGMPDAAAPIQLLTAQPFFAAGGQAPAKLWRWDFDDQLPKWQGAPDAAAPIQLLTAQHFFAAGGAAQAKFWRSDYLIDFPQWQGTPGIAAPIALLTEQIIDDAGGQVPAKFWRYDYLIEFPQWQGTPDAAAAIQLLTAQQIRGAGGETSTPPWQPIGDGIAPAWNAARYNLALGNAGAATQAPLYRWRFDPIETAPASSPAAAAPLRLLTAQVIDDAGGQAVAKLWRYDFASEGAPWNWAAPASAVLADLLTDGAPFASRWRFDLAEAIGWAFAPRAGLLLAGPAIASTWWPRLVQEAIWSSAPGAAAALRLLTAQVIDDAGGQVAAKLWRYDFASEGPPWNWAAPASAVLADLLTDGAPFAARWRFDLADDGSWVFAPRPVFLVAPAPFVMSWRPGATDESRWIWPPPANIALDEEAGVPIRALWWPIVAPEMIWRGAPSAAVALEIIKLLRQSPGAQFLIGQSPPARIIGRSGPAYIIGKAGSFIKGRP